MQYISSYTPVYTALLCNSINILELHFQITGSSPAVSDNNNIAIIATWFAVFKYKSLTLGAHEESADETLQTSLAA